MINQEGGIIKPLVYSVYSVEHFVQEYPLGDTDRHFRVISQDWQTDSVTACTFKFEVDLSITDTVVMGCLPSAKLVVSCKFSHEFINGITANTVINVKAEPFDFYFTENLHDALSGFFCKRDGILLHKSHTKCDYSGPCHFMDCIRIPDTIYCSGGLPYIYVQKEIRPQYRRVASIVTMVVQTMANEYFIEAPCTSNLFSLISYKERKIWDQLKK